MDTTGITLHMTDKFAAWLRAHDWAPHVAALVYIVAGLALLPHFQYFAFKDEINYITIAEKFAVGDLSTAPNAYWPPLLPILIAGLISIGVPSEAAAKIMSLIVGILVLYAVRCLAGKFELNQLLRNLLLFSIIPFLLYGALIFVTPDLLVAGLLSYYLSILLHPNYSARPLLGVLCGCFGAAAFLAKSYVLQFFVVHLTLVTVFLGVFQPNWPKRKLLVKNFSLAVSVFAVVAAIWVYLLYQKYHVVTLGVTGRYNYLVIGPGEMPGDPVSNIQANPINYIGLTPPADSRSISIWEEPYYLCAYLNAWSPFESKEAFQHTIRAIKTHVRVTIEFLFRFSVLTFPILAAALLLCFARRTPERRRLLLVIMSLSLAVYPAGYILMHAEERYLWPMALWFLVLGSVLLHLCWYSVFLATRARKAVILTVFSCSFILYPVQELIRRADTGRNLYEISLLLRDLPLHGSAIASNTDYGAGVVLAYRIGAKYHGTPTPKSSKEQIVEQLRKSRVGYYLHWGAPVEIAGLRSLKRVAFGDRQVTVFEVLRPSTGSYSAVRNIGDSRGAKE